MSAAADPAPSAPAGAAPSALFRERLLPGPALWLVPLVTGVAFGVILLPVSVTASVVVGVISVAAFLALTVAYSPVIEVAGGEFRMGRARIPVTLLGPVRVLTGEDWERTMLQDFEPLAHHCVRGWVRSGIRVELRDEDDPTTAWVASSRRPEDLALALDLARRKG